MVKEVKTETKTTVNVTIEKPTNANMKDELNLNGIGCLDMVIAFDTTGSMSAYINDVRRQVKEMIPRLFKDNEDLQLGLVAFGDYCDMDNATTFGDAYQCKPLTRNENDLISFVMHARDTSGGDGDEFYELVLHKIIEEMPWREDSTKAILLIADADPHELGYTYRDYVVGNQIDWRAEAHKAANLKIKIDTVSIMGRPWYNELSAMTNGICIPFHSSGNTAVMVETAATARSAMAFAERGARERVNAMRMRLDELDRSNRNEECKDINMAYRRDLDAFEAGNSKGRR